MVGVSTWRKVWNWLLSAPNEPPPLKVTEEAWVSGEVVEVRQMSAPPYGNYGVVVFIRVRVEATHPCLILVEARLIAKADGQELPTVANSTLEYPYWGPGYQSVNVGNVMGDGSLSERPEKSGFLALHAEERKEGFLDRYELRVKGKVLAI